MVLLFIIVGAACRYQACSLCLTLYTGHANELEFFTSSCGVAINDSGLIEHLKIRVVEQYNIGCNVLQFGPEGEEKEKESRIYFPWTMRLCFRLASIFHGQCRFYGSYPTYRLPKCENISKMWNEMFVCCNLQMLSKCTFRCPKCINTLFREVNMICSWPCSITGYRFWAQK